VVGYIWLFVNHNSISTINGNKYTVCLIKNATNIPCPSCGATRSVLSILNGNISGAVALNPLGFLLLFTLLITPFWLLFDAFFKKETLYLFYKKSELTIRKKQYAIPLIAVVLGNWVWNIYKGV